ncbi:hypothetical protein TSUD_280780 [Trifolium subterraneum]|uniref:Uncharacterized protein n=1 Tax=Trifolium subterraneum TaxID=3900 RepID=A0A2Z6PJN5_TRISU|nr:hypothetical protein TSUD_280780 [Trifolium subterraneum]
MERELDDLRRRVVSLETEAIRDGNCDLEIFNGGDVFSEKSVGNGDQHYDGKSGDNGGRA